MLLENKKILIVVAPEGFKDAECFIPKGIFEKSGAMVQVASLSAGSAKSELGEKLEVDFAVDEIKAKNWDAVVFVGGPGMAKMTEDESFVDLARDFYDTGKVTSAICIAPVILANAGILSGKKATVHQSGQTELEEEGADYTGEPVTVEGKVVTANGPDAAEAFARAVVKKLS